MIKKQELIHVHEDEAFLEGINLVTGLKINYDRPVLSEAELESLCVSEKLSKKQKAFRILKKGDLQQKWSIFDNLMEYITKPTDFEEVLQIIEKFFEDFSSMMDVIADGLTHGLSEMIIGIEKGETIRISEKAEKTLFRICIRALTTELKNPLAIEEWSVLFDQFFVYLGIVESKQVKEMIEECMAYVNSSFLMNAAPERRRIAFEIMKGLIEHSKMVESNAKNKISFFSTDTSGKTRSAICETMGKLIHINPQDEEIRKTLIQYLSDDSQQVKEKAFLILSSISHPRHLEAILDHVQEDDKIIEYFLLEHLEEFSKLFQAELKKNSKLHSTVIRFVNSIFKSKDPNKIAKTLPSLQYLSLALVEEKETITDVFMLHQLDYENEQIFKAILLMYSSPDSPNDLKKFFGYYVQRNLRSAKVKTEFILNIENFKLFFSVFKLETEEENQAFLSVFSKMVDGCKWPQIEFSLTKFESVRLLDLNYEKVCAALLKLLLNCPYYLVESVCRAVLLLILSKRRNLDFFLMMKDKLLGSKTWSHRRNYIVLYSQVKCGSSYEFQKIIPLLNYKVISKERSFGVKLEFVRRCIRIYESVDPSSEVEKSLIKQTLADLTKDRDSDVKEAAFEELEKFAKIESSAKSIENNLQRNSMFLLNEEKLRQKEALSKKTKTQKQLGRLESKSKTINMENRTSIKIARQSASKLINVEKLNRPSTVLGSNRAKGGSKDEKGPSKIVRYASGQVMSSNKIKEASKGMSKRENDRKKL